MNKYYFITAKKMLFNDKKTNFEQVLVIDRLTNSPLISRAGVLILVTDNYFFIRKNRIS